MADKWIERFTAEIFPVIRRIYQPHAAILFGSRVEGRASEESDIDAIIVSPAFGNIPFVKRAGQLLRLFHFPKHIDYLCYSPDEFEKVRRSSCVIMDAIEHGITLK